MSKNRKHNRSRKHRSNRRHRGGNALHGSPLADNLAGSWPSRMSLGQGADYFKYHQGQHGGAMLDGAPLSAITGSALPDALRGPAHLGGLDKAFVDINGLKDQAGGRRRTRHHKKRNHKNKSRKNKSRKNKSRKNKSNRKNKSRRNRRTRRRGGALGYAPFPASSGMLLDKMGYQQAGLNPEWKSDISFSMAKIRDSQ